MKRFLMCMMAGSLLPAIVSCAKRDQEKLLENVVIAEEVNDVNEVEELGIEISSGRIVWGDKERSKFKLSKEAIERRIFQADLEKIFPKILESRPRIKQTESPKVISAIIFKNPYDIPYKINVSAADTNAVSYTLRALLSTLSTNETPIVNDYGTTSSEPIKVTGVIISVLETGEKLNSQTETDGTISAIIPPRTNAQIGYLTRFEGVNSELKNSSEKINISLPKDRKDANCILQLSVKQDFILKYMPDVKTDDTTLANDWTEVNKKIDGKIEVVGVLRRSS